MRKCDWCGNYFDGSYWYHREEGKLPKGCFCSPKCGTEARGSGFEGSPHALETAANVVKGAAEVVVGAAVIAAGLYKAGTVAREQDSWRVSTGPSGRAAARGGTTATAGRCTPSRRVAATGGAAAARGAAASRRAASSETGGTARNDRLRPEDCRTGRRRIPVESRHVLSGRGWSREGFRRGGQMVPQGGRAGASRGSEQPRHLLRQRHWHGAESGGGGRLVGASQPRTGMPPPKRASAIVSIRATVLLRIRRRRPSGSRSGRAGTRRRTIQAGHLL